MDGAVPVFADIQGVHSVDGMVQELKEKTILKMTVAHQ